MNGSSDVDFFHVDCPVTLRRLYVLFVLEIGASVPEPVLGEIRSRPVLGGLINQYEPAA